MKLPISIAHCHEKKNWFEISTEGIEAETATEKGKINFDMKN